MSADQIDSLNGCPLRHRMIAGHGVQLHAVEAGSGPVVLLVHGFPEFWYSWRHQIPALVLQGYRVVAIDMRGYNLSDKPAGIGSYGIRMLVDDIRSVISQYGGSVHGLVGHDWGGIVCWYTAMWYPELFEKLVILNAPHPARFAKVIWHPRQFFRSLYCLFHQLPWLPERFWLMWHCAFLRLILRLDPVRLGAFTQIDRLRYAIAASQPGAMRSMLHYYRNFRVPQGCMRWYKDSRVIQKPTMLIWGSRDRYLLPRLTRHLARWVTALRLEVLPASHWVHNDLPEAVNDCLRDFL